jgi:hypothetical protein
MMFERLTTFCALTLALTCSVASAQVQPVQPQQPYPPGAYQPAPYPQAQQPQYPQAQPQYPQQPYPQAGYPPPEAAPAYGPAPGAYPPGAYPPGYVPPGYAPPPEAVLTSVEGKLQLSLGTTFVRYRSTSFEADAGGGELDVSELSWGFSDSSNVILEAGYGLTERLLIGGVLQLGGESSTTDNGVDEAESSEFQFLLGPKVDFHFLPTSKFNPFVGAIVAINVGSGSEGPAVGPVETSSLLFTFLLRGGVRVFVNESLSLDPAIVFGFATGSGSQEVGAMKGDFSQSGFQFGLSLSASYWL